MDSRVAVLSIIVENEEVVGELNELLHRFGKYIILPSLKNHSMMLTC